MARVTAVVDIELRTLRGDPLTTNLPAQRAIVRMRTYVGRRAGFALILTLVAVSAAAPEAAEARPTCRSFSGGLLLPYWARQRHVTVLNDSVLLSGAPELRTTLACRRMRLRGRPALMLRAADRELRRARQHVAPLVVVGLGYNSLWERNGHRYDYWAARFDGEATRLVATLRRLGARQIIWVTLREPRAQDLTPAGRAELSQYSWYFPYVNNRLRILDARRDDVVLADWTAVSNQPGLTYDAIHLTTKGGRLMARTIKATINDEARRQAEARPIAGTR